MIARVAILNLEMALEIVKEVLSSFRICVFDDAIMFPEKYMRGFLLRRV